MKDNRELVKALAEACTKLGQIQGLAYEIADEKLAKRIVSLSNSSGLTEVLQRHQTNQLIIRKIDNSTLTRVDVKYKVILVLKTDQRKPGMLDNRVYMTAGEYSKISAACVRADEIEKMLKAQGIEFEFVDETYDE